MEPPRGADEREAGRLARGLGNGAGVPDILVHCPVTGESVPTGLDTETVVFASLPIVVMPFECPSCRQTHYWKPGDAWVDGETRPMRR